MSHKRIRVLIDQHQHNTSQGSPYRILMSTRCLMHFQYSKGDMRVVWGHIKQREHTFNRCGYWISIIPLGSVGYGVGAQ